MSKKDLSKVEIKIDIYQACRTNTARARKSDGHYDLKLLSTISGFRPDDLISDLQWCAERGEDELAIETINNIANSLLSAYQIQRDTY